MIVPCISLNRYEYPRVTLPTFRRYRGSYSNDIGIGPNPTQGSFVFIAQKTGTYTFGPYSWYMNAGNEFVYDKSTGGTFVNKVNVGEFYV